MKYIVIFVLGMITQAVGLSGVLHFINNGVESTRTHVDSLKEPN